MINVAPSLNEITILVLDVAHNYLMTSCKFIIFIISMAERHGSMKILNSLPYVNIVMQRNTDM